ncbi:hypothetical protein LNO78_27640 [Klebsiella pneumoniae subsp. pneumoniae]|nr:hypothetical protein [Klebsiella pneumoniae subsp. pneumoniae]
MIATEARYAPFEMLEDGKIVGLGKDILTEVMKGITRGESGSAGYSISGDFARPGKQTI